MCCLRKLCQYAAEPICAHAFAQMFPSYYFAIFIHSMLFNHLLLTVAAAVIAPFFCGFFCSAACTQLHPAYNQIHLNDSTTTSLPGFQIKISDNAFLGEGRSFMLKPHAETRLAPTDCIQRCKNYSTAQN